ncbi:MAG TPA: hypothetical protein VM911_05595 [Pyrinomonadaceae bacterium]|jgi:hypothetical protein|nr:hypothetical protein [Pyrinomonadaceae bacterium]
MNKLIRLMTLSALVATLALPALVYGTSLQSTGAAQEGQDATAEQNALYKKFTDNRTAHPEIAYEAAKEFLQKYPSADEKIITYLKKWIPAYEKAIRKPNLIKLMTESKYADAYTLSKQILVDEPNDLLTLRQAAVSGFNLAVTNKEVNAIEAANYARKALQLIEAGKSFEEGTPMDAALRDENIGLLNLALGFFALKSNPSEAVAPLLRAAQSNSTFKKDPQTYIWLANAYQAGPYKKLSDEFEANYRGKDETPESKAALENLNQVIDRIIDASARAIALATDPKYAAIKTQLNTQLTSFYKFRHNDSEAGLPEMIAGILSKPLPPQPTLVAVPAPATSATTPTPTAPGAGTTPATTPASTQPTTTAPASTPPSTQPAPTNPPATPPATTPSKPKVP